MLTNQTRATSECRAEKKQNHLRSLALVTFVPKNSQRLLGEWIEATDVTLRARIGGERKTNTRWFNTFQKRVILVLVLVQFYWLIFLKVVRVPAFQMGRLSLLFWLQFQLVYICSIVLAEQPSDFFPFFTQNETAQFNDKDDNLLIYDRPEESADSLYQNHSIHRRQVPLNILTSQQARIPITPSYIVLGPRTVRPAQLIALSVIVLRDEWNPMMVKALISNEDMNVAAAEDLFSVGVPRTLEMRIPNNVRSGTYRLTLEGKLLTGEQKFYNVSELLFEQKAVAILIQLDRPVYRHETVVQFRCIPIYPDLSGYYHTIDVFMIGPSGHILRKWENQQTTAGMVSLEVRIPLSLCAYRSVGWCLLVSDQWRTARRYLVD